MSDSPYRRDNKVTLQSRLESRDAYIQQLLERAGHERQEIDGLTAFLDSLLILEPSLSRFQTKREEGFYLDDYVWDFERVQAAVDLKHASEALRKFEGATTVTYVHPKKVKKSTTRRSNA